MNLCLRFGIHVSIYFVGDPTMDVFLVVNDMLCLILQEEGLFKPKHVGEYMA